MARHRAIKHVHRFRKIVGKSVSAWRCALDDCPYIMHTNQQELMLGRKTQCWGCGNIFPMREDNLEQEMPTCLDCWTKEFLSDESNTVQEKGVS